MSSETSNADPITPAQLGRVLFVGEVDASVRAAADALRERYRTEVNYASCGSEAAMMIRKLGSAQTYHVIFTDLYLSDMPGLDLLLKLRKTLESTAVVFMYGFGYDAAPLIAKARHLGLQGVVYKPIRIDQLVALIERLGFGGSTEA